MWIERSDAPLRPPLRNFHYTRTSLPMRRALSRRANGRDTIDVDVKEDPYAKPVELTIAWLAEILHADDLMPRADLTVAVQPAVRP